MAIENLHAISIGNEIYENKTSIWKQFSIAALFENNNLTVCSKLLDILLCGIFLVTLGQLFGLFIGSTEKMPAEHIQKFMESKLHKMFHVGI